MTRASGTTVIKVIKVERLRAPEIPLTVCVNPHRLPISARRYVNMSAVCQGRVFSAAMCVCIRRLNVNAA